MRGWIAKLSLVLMLFGIGGLSRPAVSQESLPPGCSPTTPLPCFYTSDLFFSDIRVVRLTLTDPARGGYQLPILIRYPHDSVGRRPIVIFNHGGEPRANGREGSVEWSTLLAASGYVVIHPSRNLIVNPAPFAALCAANGAVGNTGCINFISHSIYGPRNTDFIINSLGTIQTSAPALLGRFDASKLAVAGWSAGTTVALANAGATRRFKEGGPLYNQKSTRPIAFLAVAPFGPDYAGFYYSPLFNFGGFQSASFDTIDERPFLFVTGKGDYGPGVGLANTPVKSEARTMGWLRSMQGRKYLAWDTQTYASHGTMNVSDCNTVAKLHHCGGIRTTALAFMDSVLRNRLVATRWLASDALKVLLGNEIELHRR